MKRILLLACALAASTLANAQLYKWVDKDGRVTYSDQPPPALQSKQLSISTGTSAPQRSAIEMDKELEKGRAEARDKAMADEQAASRAKADAENCLRARGNLRTLTDEGRITTYDEKGERIFLDETQIRAERVKAQRAVDDLCKTS
jgi:hypothetical protein